MIHLDLDFLLQPIVTKPLIAVEADRGDTELRSNVEKQVDLIVLHWLQTHFDVLEQLGSVERANVAIDRDLVVLLALAQRHVRPGHLLVHIGQASEVDDELPDRGRFRLIRSLFILGENGRSHCQGQKWEKEESDGTIPYNFQSGCILFGRLISDPLPDRYVAWR